VVCPLFIDAKSLTKAIQDNPQAAIEAAFNGIWPAITGIPGGVKDGFIETGSAIGEGAAVALDPELTAKLVDIYGTDVASLQKAALAIRVLASVTGAAAVGKAGSKVAEATTKAVVKKLDEVKAAKLEAEALAKAREEINARRDDAKQYDHFLKPDSKVPGGEWDWQKQAPNNGAVPGTQQAVTVQRGAFWIDMVSAAANTCHPLALRTRRVHYLQANGQTLMSSIQCSSHLQ
jgi:hypothetical protein